MAEADGSRRKPTEEGGWRKQNYNRSIFSANMAHGMLGFRICSIDIIILAPRHVAISHTDQKRPETGAGGRWRKLTEAEKWNINHYTRSIFAANSAHGPLGFQICSPNIALVPSHVATIHTDQKRPEKAPGGSWRGLTESDGS